MNKLLWVSMVATGLLVNSTPAFAWGYDRDDHGRDWGHDEHHGGYSRHYVPYGREVHSLDRGFVRLFIGGMEYFFWEGMYYRHMNDRYVVVQAPIGAVVTTIPPEAQMVVVDGVPYYTVNGVTYVSTTYGYQVVPPPKVIVIRTEPAVQQTVVTTPAPVLSPVTPVQAPPPPTVALDDTFTVNIPNAKGTYTAVIIKRSGNGFVGPQGEYYSEFPKVDQLKLMYSK